MRNYLQLFWITLALHALAAFGYSSNAGDYPIVPVPFTEVDLQEGFWRARLETNAEVTIPYCLKLCEETGRISNFLAAAKKDAAGFQGIRFDDSDVFKIVEGASYALALRPDAKLDRYLDRLIEKFASAQESDGYLFTAKTSGSEVKFAKGPRWDQLQSSHELYNVGHLYEAAVAHFQATGKRSLLDIALKNADLVAEVFGPGEGQRKDVPGHQEIELGLVRLHRVTGDQKYLDLAKFFIDMRGRGDVRKKLYGKYAQDHVPVLEHEQAVGHAVRAGYLYASVADIAALTDNSEYTEAIDRIWNDVVRRKLYLIGSVGQHGGGEGYAGAYKLSNLRAYNETCAAIALALWSQRMFLLTGDSKYVDVLERTLYNGFLSGVSLSGDRFFYPNPLSCDLKYRFNHGDLERSPWFNCSCCPSNVARFVPSLPGYVYATKDKSLYVNLYVASESEIEVDGQPVRLLQQSDYPWDGAVLLTVTPPAQKQFSLRLRIPGWVHGEPVPSDLYQYESPKAAEWALKVNGESITPELEAGYAVINRLWQAGDEIELELPMPVRRVVANAKVEENKGRVAFERGPIVYCVEGADHDGSVKEIWIPEHATFDISHSPELLGGVTVLTAQGQSAYRSDDGTVASRAQQLTMIPYHAWCHRGPNEMAVWLPRTPDLAYVPPLPTLASTSKVTASHKNPRDSLSALNDTKEPESSNDHEVPRFTWWNHLGTSEWIQYELEKPTRLSATEVYWFDDTGRGKCRVPKSWKLLYRDGSDWQQVQPLDDYGLSPDQFNRVRFAPIETDALRLEVKLQPEFSAGILEWTVEDAVENSAGSNSSVSKNRPNFILVFVDDLGWGDFSCFGNQSAKTENIDRLAQEGVRFTQFYVNSPICSPSRVAITTGLYPQRLRIGSYLAHRKENAARGIANWLDPDVPTLADMLQTAGYTTGHFGKWHMGGQRDIDDAPSIKEYGFDASLTNFEGMGPKLLPLTLKPGDKKPKRIWEDAERLGEGARWMLRSEITGGFVDEAISFIATAKRDGKPFYVNLWPDDVHVPLWPPTSKWAKTARGRYLSVLQEMDRQLGELFDFVQTDPKLRDNTMILVCSDNGPALGAGEAGPLRGYKTQLYEGGIRSPLVVWAPGMVAKRNHINRTSVFSAIDLVPTLAELVGSEHSNDVQFDGESLPGVLLGKSEASREAPICFRRPPDRDAFYGDEDLPDLAIRSGKWKLLCEYDGSDRQLYDLELDPVESSNKLAKFPEIAEELTTQVVKWHLDLPQDLGESYQLPKAR